ncbi:hypothetical protein BS47DRAFT_1338044, partial [Hydnum rufescens UP504]
MTAEYDLSSLRNILLGAAPVSTKLILDPREKLRKKGGKYLEITQAFGLTETTYVFNIFKLGSFIDAPTIIPINSAVTHILPPELSVKKVECISTLLPNQEARLVDEDENDVNEGERGELWIRGDNLMKWAMSRLDIYGWVDWFKRGDIATRDSEDFYAIVDRKKELIKIQR